MLVFDKKSPDTYKSEMSAELSAILSYWALHTLDLEHGGFIGQIDENDTMLPNAPKGAILNCRILWAFSAAHSLTNDKRYLDLASVAYNYLAQHFVDRDNAGIYWLLNADGTILDSKKQVYAQAFAVYGLSAYYKASNHLAAKELAIQIYRKIEQHSFDEVHTGYLEAFTSNWQPIDDLRLSNKEPNEKKTMNTHLHLLEAYTQLYLIWPDEALKEKIILLLKNFTTQIVHPRSAHLQLFFNEQWEAKSGIVSYGHDIEASWLLLEAAEAVKDIKLINEIRALAIKIVQAASAGLDSDGGLWYEYLPTDNHFIKEKHSWVQAEAMIGYLNAWQITGDTKYFDLSFNSWQYVKSFIKDNQHGEWFWGRNEDGTIMQGQDKVGIWKCPYHNSRACIEIIRRLS